MTPAAEQLRARLEYEGRAHVPIPRRLHPGELASALMAVSRVAAELGEDLGDDFYMAVVRGSRIRKPTAEWVWIFWTESGAEAIDQATRRELGL